MSDVGDHVWDKKWDEFFARTQELPSPERARPFLDTIPTSGRVLDFGCGSGRWTAAFLRDRPDLTVDVTDQLIDKANLLPPDFQGERTSGDFADFVPRHAYDGIFAYAALFFIPHPTQLVVFQRLVGALRPGGTLLWTMVEEGDAATSVGFHAMSEARLREQAAQSGLEITVFKKVTDSEYGPQRRVIPTFFIRATKKP